MIEDDSPKQKTPSHQVGQDLSQLAVTEIDERIALLQEEILRLRQAREKKMSSQAAAEALFRR